MKSLKDAIDFAEVEALYSVIEKVIAHSGKNVGILAVANERLKQIEEEAKEIRDEIVAEQKAEEEKKAAARRNDNVDNDGDGEVDEEDEGEVDDENDDPPPAGRPRAIPSNPGRRV